MAISLSSFASSFSALIISSSRYVSAVSLVTTRILSTVSPESGFAGSGGTLGAVGWLLVALLGARATIRQ